LHDRPHAKTANTAPNQLAHWFNDYNQYAPHKGLRIKSPRQFIRSQLAVAPFSVWQRQPDGGALASQILGDFDTNVIMNPGVSDLNAIAEKAAQLRLSGQIKAAIDLVAAKTKGMKDPAAVQLRHAYSPLWWAPVEGRRCTLRRRGPEDLAFIRQCWADQDFMRRFNRLANRLPESDDELKQILKREYTSLPAQVGALHWTIATREGRQVGILSFVNIGKRHRRAEVLIGIRDNPYSGCAGEAMYVAMEFAMSFAGLEKTYALLYRENENAIRNILHLGFVSEGIQRGHILDPVSRQRVDIVQAGFLRSDFSKPQVVRLFGRLLGRSSRV
jgi:RimJ/RimL family protein N-acetyltransferase